MNYRRIKIVFSLFLLTMTLLTLRISYISILLHRKYCYLSVSQRIHTFIYHSNRGDIVDRNLILLTDREVQGVKAPNLSSDGNPIYVQKSIRDSQIAEHLIGKVGYSPLYKIQGFQGLFGLEKQYNKELAGQEGKLVLVVDSSNRPVYFREPKDIPGKKNENTLVLTLCSSLQQRLERVIRDENLIDRGAVIVMDPYNGQVLAMVSRPDLNYLNIDDGSHLNKGVQIKRNYHPASVFKMVIALYALEEGVSPHREFICDGTCCHSAHGKLTFEEGFALSCNSVFYQLVLEFGTTEILDFAKKLGFGEKTGINLYNESRGRLPDQSIVNGKEGALLLALGQGDLETTPLQISKLTATIANGGYQITPQIVYYIGENPTKVPESKGYGQRVVTERSVNSLKEMMKKTTLIGTAKGLNGFGGVKTGTADNKNRWITGFFPGENPEVVVTIFIEEGYGKSTTEVARRILETIFSLN
jgi:cell division protein FtsI/penicillin-binding protein 2